MWRFSLFLTLALLGPGTALAMGDRPPPAPPAAEATAPTVTVAPAVRAEVQARVPLSGTLVAREVVQVTPRIEGQEILSLGAEPGDRVEQGQELARLSDVTLRAQLAQADAELQRATAGVAQAESQIASNEAALAQAVAALERARSLRQSGSGTQAALDQAVAAEAAARGVAASSREGIEVARATEAQARASRDIAQINLDRTRITAPVAGRVSSRNAQLGSIATASAGPMFTLIADGSIEFEGEVIETALPALRPGQTAELDVAGVGRITGRVRQLPAAVDATTRLGLVRVELSADERLLIGLFVSGDIVTERREAVTVPATAVLADASGERVQVVRDGVVETRAVRAGLLWQGQREITEGLAEGETVIARAGAFFRSGDRVSATTEPQDAPPGGAMADNPGAAPPAAAAESRGDQASAASDATPPLAAQAAETGAVP